MARPALASLAALLAAVTVLAGSSPAAAAVSGETAQRTVTYEVRVRGTVLADPAGFARIAARTLADRRGWSLGGSQRFVQVPSGGQFTLWLAAPSSMRNFSTVCSDQYSCRVGRHVVINDARWRTGTPTWPAVREYQRYVLNHEVGHWLGLGHASCPAPGAPAPVMQQQSISLQGCRSSTWPSEPERRRAAAVARVPVRPRTPSLLALDRSGTAVSTLDGASGWTTRRTVASSLPSTTEGTWTFRLADHDRDGVDDLYAVEHRSGAAVAVTVLSGASGYRTALARVVTPLQVPLDRAYAFALADLDGDGLDDLLAVDGQGPDGTQVHVLTGASGLTTLRPPVQTALHRTAAGQWSFATGDQDRDGVPDLYALKRAGTSGRTEVHVLSGAGGFRRWLQHAVTPIGVTRPDDWSFEVADTTGDGRDDLLAVQRSGASGRTEVHVLDTGSTRWASHSRTALPPTTGEQRWSFDLS